VKTSWYPSDTKPIRDGRYEILDSDNNICEVLFVGGMWYWIDNNKDETCRCKNQDMIWRGLVYEASDLTIALFGN
jgi:hypothetical protein